MNDSEKQTILAQAMIDYPLDSFIEDDIGEVSLVKGYTWCSSERKECLFSMPWGLGGAIIYREDKGWVGKIIIPAPIPPSMDYSVF